MMPRKLNIRVALVLFENRIEDVVGGGQEDERTDEQSQRDEDVGEIRAVGVYGAKTMAARVVVSRLW